VRYEPEICESQEDVLARPRVAITGLGVIAPNGIGKDAFWRSLVHGKSAVDYIRAFDAVSYPCRIAAEVSNFDPGAFITPSKARTMGRFAQFAVGAAKLAITDAALLGTAQPQMAVCLGTSMHGMGDIGAAAFEAFLAQGHHGVSASVGLEVGAHAATAHVQQALNIRGPMMTIASACCTGIDAISWGADQIRSGTVDFALVGGVEAPISEFTFSLFLAGGFLSTWSGKPEEASRPYDRFRSGLVLSEGGAVLVLEELRHAIDRGATIYAEVRGYSSVPEGDSRDLEERYVAGLRDAILSAVDAGRLDPHELDYICAHGNSTKFDDRAEAKAHRAALGDSAYRIPVSSIKSMIGHPFAASGALQAVATAMAVYTNIAPPTINYEHRDPDCDLDYVPNTARVVRMRHALLHGHSLGGKFPGSHSAMVLTQLTL
jgi:3-oxoacyl-[acyl-carrier-protein] synthase II